jgi:hypothetical protein
MRPVCVFRDPFLFAIVFPLSFLLLASLRVRHDTLERLPR